MLFIDFLFFYFVLSSKSSNFALEIKIYIIIYD